MPLFFCTSGAPAQHRHAVRAMARRRSVGAELVGGGVDFRVWAPARSRVAVVIGRDEFPLDVEQDGYFSKTIGGAGAGTRYRFRALKPHGEVIFWMVGSSEPSGKFNDCKIQDGRNWVCNVCADASRSITLQMAHGKPVEAVPVTRPYRAVSKWRWLLLRRGYTAGRPVPPAVQAAAAG
jgi:hypothetical protein